MLLYYESCSSDRIPWEDSVVQNAQKCQTDGNAWHVGERSVLGYIECLMKTEVVSPDETNSRYF